MRVIRAASHRAMPWRNGGGVTREVLAEPDPADPAGFLWRVSIATVATPGPFSRFPGVDRSIAVLQGPGMRLDVGGETVTLRPGDPPFRFAGDADVRSELIAGETTDLNAMSRRGAFAHEMRPVRCDGTATMVGQASVSLLVFNGRAAVSSASFRTEVGRFDVVADIEPGARVDLHSDGPCDAFLISLYPPATGGAG